MNYTSRNNFDALLSESSESFAKEAFQPADVQLELFVRNAVVLESGNLRYY